MEELLKMLEEIYKVLEQIQGITVNQTTILLQVDHMSEEAEGLEMLESMVAYKEEMINEVSQKEELFNSTYEEFRGKITDKAWVERFKKQVEKILRMKEKIVNAEQNNILLMQGFGKKSKEQISIQANRKTMVVAYQKQSSNKY